ncbi:MAG: hypothetical protein HC825_03525 [Oscillatoriales cyanobacterium RM1_1_9]|nr:hypothetical protein [Oscillatoriales cyanobacterium SM2_3_0]NJO44612.1 hypothetical protein [Oscillatoriales cyanobacterium RM2_1_1]NJO71013.1 hypothetical protein [Oscillatoriales cyanobacterium RM1_1_9]
MQRLDAEKYGWQNILGGDTLEVQLQPWLIGALRMACEGTTASRQATVSGTVTYSQRVALPPDAVVEVQLVDISLADAPAIVIDQQTIKTDGQQVPIPFTLSYNPANIDPRHRYAVQARILFEGQLRWISTTSYLVLTQGNPSTIEVVVDPVAL